MTNVNCMKNVEQFIVFCCSIRNVGNNLLHQLTLIVNTLGTPDVDFVTLAHAERIKDFLLS